MSKAILQYRDLRAHLRRAWLMALLVLCLLALPALAQVQEREADRQAEIENRLAAAAERLRKFSAANPQMPAEQSDAYALARLKLEQAQLFLRNYWPGTYRDALVASQLETAERLTEALAAGRKPDLPTHDRLERAYVAPNDGSVQPYQLYVPESYDGTKPFGLLVYLHGYSPDLDKANWVRYMYADVLDQYCDQAGYILLMPFARSNTDFQGCGEDDVMLTLDKVLGQYRIDPDRVVMSGYSMGGMGAWTIAAHYPHRFAGVLAMASRSDFYMWKRLKAENLPGFKPKLAEQEFGANLLPNYSNLPVFMMHGGMDFGIPTRQSRVMYERLRERGVDAQYVELPDAGHLFFYRETECRPAMLAWLKKVKRKSAPRKITYRAHNLKYNRAYWVEILGISDWGKAADVTCELSEDGKSLDVTTDNVLYLRLKPPVPLENLGDLKLTWNGKEAHAVADKAGYLYLGGWGVGDAPALKSPALSGPVREVFAGPFVMVYGGEENGVTHKRAQQAARDWERLAQGKPRLLPAADLDEQAARTHNVILFGTPENNPWIAKAMPFLPIKIEGGQYHVGDRRYDAGEFGLWMIYPSPFGPGRYVSICSGPAWGRGLAGNHKYDFLPDFIVYADEKSEDGTESGKFVCAGFFDQFWGLSEKSTWHSDQPR